MENITEKHIYNKICLHCHKPFTSTSRGTRYCSPDCQKSHAARVQKRRRNYNKNAEYEALVNKAYRLSMEVAMFLNPKPADEDPNDPYELHHINGNVFDTSPFNTVWVKKSEHAKIHTKLRDIAMVDYMKIVKAKPELLEMAKKLYLDFVLAGEDKKVEELPPEMEMFTALQLTKRFKIKASKLDV